jgi:hypothetical protein
MTPQILEGTWEEIASHAPELRGRRVRLTVLPDEEADPTLALFARWEEEDERATPEERENDDRVYSEIEKNGVSRTRI